MAEKMTKADLNFLRKVESRKVFRVRGYTKRKGGYERFVGGEATAQRYVGLGLIRMAGVPELGRPSYAELTPAGVRALDEATHDR